MILLSTVLTNLIMVIVAQGSKFSGYRRTVITKGFIKIDFLDEYEC